VELERIAPGLWRWTAWHEEWKEDVGSVLYRRGATACLIDPLLPPNAVDALDPVLDGSETHVLVTVFWHTRSAHDCVQRYGAAVWAPSRGRAAVERRAQSAPRTFRPGDELPLGIEAYATARGNEVVFWLPKEQTLVPGDVILGASDGGLRLCPDSWLPGRSKQTDLRESLRPLLDLPVDRVLVSHGAALPSGGRRALRRLLA
jgi:glyoxylase-like metal-dependent hydrolase (beta-lactamase superfamily II)